MAFGSVGTLAIGVMDLITGHGAFLATAQDILSTVAVVALSHYAGSAARTRQRRAERAAFTAEAQHFAASFGFSFLRKYVEPASIKNTAEMVKALYDAATPLVATAAALWAAFAHILS